MPGAAATTTTAKEPGRSGWVNKESQKTAALHARRCAVPIFQLKGRKKLAQKQCNKCV